MLFLILMLMTAQRETFYELYESGVDKLKEGRHAEAIVDLEKAVAIRPESKAQARTYSMFTIVYTPYYQLTKAYMYQKDYEKVAEYLALAYEHKEDTFEGGRLSIDLELMNQVIRELTDNRSAMREKDEKIKDLELASRPVEAPDYLPISEKLSLQDFDGAKREADKLLFRHPGNEEVRAYRESLLEFVDSERQRLRREESYNEQIGAMIATARERELAEAFPEALQAYRDVREVDPNHEEAEAGVLRVTKRLEELGKTEQEILELQRTNKENRDVIEQLIVDNNSVKKAKDASDAALRRLASREPRARAEIHVDWTVKPVRSRVANIQATVDSTVDLNRVVLYLEGTELKSWPLKIPRKNFTTPLLAKYPVGKSDTVFELKAWAVDGSILGDTYPFSFAPPVNFFSRKIRYVLTISLTAIIAFFFFLSQYRRRKLFRQRFNPYVAGAPILNQKMFYGRDTTLKQILNTLHNNSLMIFGERRIGKTSFLHRLNEELPLIDDPQYEFIPSFVDLQGVREEDFFLTLDAEISQVLETRGMAMGIPPETLSSRQFISRLRKNINMLKEQCQKKPKLVLLLDEVDVMNGFSEQTNQQLRSVFMKGFAEHIVAVMAGIHINKKWKSEGSPWYNFFEQIELKPFHKNHADDLIIRPVQGVYNYTSAAVNRIMEITGGKPYLIQKMCLNLVSHILVENRRQVTAEDVDFVFKGIEKEFYGA